MKLAPALIRLYPRAWRERYAVEFGQLVADVSGERVGWRLAVDMLRGAADAHIQRRFGMRRVFAHPAVRRGVFDGLIISLLVAINVVITNVVFPPGPDESDSDPEYIWQTLAIYAVLALLLVAIGARARRRGPNATAGLIAGGVAGVVIGVLVTVTFVAVNNLFLSVVSQQHDKRIAFAASGWTSMRAYLTVEQLLGGVFLVVALGAVGAALGLLGAALFRPRSRTIEAAR
jgi:hypothetical protein